MMTEYALSEDDDTSAKGPSTEGMNPTRRSSPFGTHTNRLRTYGMTFHLLVLPGKRLDNAGEDIDSRECTKPC